MWSKEKHKRKHQLPIRLCTLKLNYFLTDEYISCHLLLPVKKLGNEYYFSVFSAFLLLKLKVVLFCQRI